MLRRIGILTGGGDAPGLNAVIRAFVKAGVRHRNLAIVGVEDSFNGLLDTPRRLRTLDLPSCRGLLHLGGTVLGTTNRGDPFAWPSPEGSRDRSRALAVAVADEGIEGLVVIGGDGTQAIAHGLMTRVGIPVIGVPKTIDNDLAATDVTFGFQSAVDCATDALDRLHATAEAHDRIMILEVMGRDAGHIALHAGVAGGADVILVPEIAWNAESVAAKINARRAVGRPFSLVVVAEGSLPDDGDARPARERLRAGHGAGAIAAAALHRVLDADIRVTVLGHLQRGGSPVAVDRILATRFGVHAANLAAERRWGRLVALQNGAVVDVPLGDAVGGVRLLSPQTDPLVAVARQTGIAFGDEPTAFSAEG